MSFKFDSLLIILNKLDTGDVVTCRSLMTDLEISERSAYRYVTSLQVAGFPIYYDRKRGTYAFSEGFCLHHPEVSQEENLSLALAKRLLAPWGQVAQGLAKIEDRLNAKSTYVPVHLAGSSMTAERNGGQFFNLLHQAIASRTVVKMTYEAAGDGNKSTRLIEPIYLFIHDDFLYVRAYCQRALANRTFGLDCIRKLTLTKQHFTHHDVEADDELSRAFGSVVDGEETEVVLRFEQKCIPQLARRQQHMSQRQQNLKDGRIELRFTVNGTEGIRRWLYQWLPDVEVVAPESLRRQVAEETKKMYDKHSAQR